MNAAGRQPGGSWVSVLDIDEPGADGLFGLRQMKVTGYRGAAGPSDVDLDLHGFDVEVIDNERLRFWLINHRPPVDENGIILDATKVGANSTIEVFESKRGEDELVHVRTIWDEAIFTPNKLAATGDGGLVVTNDMSSKGELRSVSQWMAFVDLRTLSRIGKSHRAWAIQMIPRELILGS